MGSVPIWGRGFPVEGGVPIRGGASVRRGVPVGGVSVPLGGGAPVRGGVVAAGDESRRRGSFVIVAGGVPLLERRVRHAVGGLGARDPEGG